jgi:hypothetical protein
MLTLKMVPSFILGWLVFATMSTSPSRSVAYGQLDEKERMKEYIARNYTWPLPLESYIPPTQGWKDLMEHRLRQISEIDDFQLRYEGYIQTLNAAICAPNFTQYGKHTRPEGRETSGLVRRFVFLLELAVCDVTPLEPLAWCSLCGHLLFSIDVWATLSRLHNPVPHSWIILFLGNSFSRIFFTNTRPMFTNCHLSQAGVWHELQMI